MANFTPWASLSGGLLIGLAVALLWLGNGRVAGISGMVGNLAVCRLTRCCLARRLPGWPDRGAVVLRRSGWERRSSAWMAPFPSLSPGDCW